MPEAATALRTRSASCPMMANTSRGGTTLVAAAITWARSGLPPTSCSTLGCLDFSLVPLPAASMAMAIFRRPGWWLFVLGIRSNIPRELCAGQGYGRYWWDGWCGADTLVTAFDSNSCFDLLCPAITANQAEHLGQSQRRRTRVSATHCLRGGGSANATGGLGY